MVFSKAQALEAARNIWSGPRVLEAERLNFIASAVNPRRAYSAWLNAPLGLREFGAPTVEMPEDAPQVMKNLAWKARTNFLPLILDVFSQVIKADGYIEANGIPSDAWRYWQVNGLDARQTGIHRSALEFGASYASILPGSMNSAPAPVIKGYSPRRMTAVYQDPDIDDWPMMALDVNGPMLRLFDETSVYRIGIEQYPISGLGAALTINPGQQFVYLDQQSHGLDFCPVARFRDRMLLHGEEQFGIVEQLIDMQRRIDETTFGMLTAQYFAAFKQRYVIGWVPQSQMEQLKAEVSSFWAFKDDTVKVGEFTETDLTRYITSKDSALSDMAAIAQVPASSLGNSATSMRNVSPEAVASNDAGQDRKGMEIKTSFGETWELVLRTAALLDGDTAAASDTSSQIRWRDMSTTSPGAIVDALGKLQQMLGIPAEMLWERIPGWTDQDQARAIDLIKSGDSLDKLMFVLNKQATPAPSGGPGGQ
ncbi:MAG TPA: phage portal protein [Acidothermaceae bacterium]